MVLHIDCEWNVWKGGEGEMLRENRKKGEKERKGKAMGLSREKVGDAAWKKSGERARKRITEQRISSVNDYLSQRFGEKRHEAPAR